MVRERWDPFRDLHRMEETVDRLWRGFGTRWNAAREGDWGIPLDVIQDESKVTVRASVPGVKPADITVTVDDGVLTIKGQTAEAAEQTEGRYLLRERRTGSFSRRVRLPETVDADKAESAYEDGVLEITLPKLEAKKPKSIEIGKGAAPTPV